MVLELLCFDFVFVGIVVDGYYVFVGVKFVFVGFGEYYCVYCVFMFLVYEYCG